MNLLQLGDFTLHSNKHSNFKIECDAFTRKDWSTLAKLISEKVSFRDVFGIPTGGLKLERALKKHIIEDEELPYLIIDDVLSTGESMIEFRNKKAVELNTGNGNFVGVVIFSRTHLEFDWLMPIFQMWNQNDNFLENETIEKTESEDVYEGEFKINWDDFRNADGFNLIELYHYLHPEVITSDKAEEYLRTVSSIRPIFSRQIAATALAYALTL